MEACGCISRIGIGRGERNEEAGLKRPAFLLYEEFIRTRELRRNASQFAVATACLVRADFHEAVVVYAEIVGNFVLDDVMDEGAHLVVILTLGEDGAAINADAVGCDVAVLVPALRDRDAVIESEQLVGVGDVCGLHRPAVGEFFDDDGEVVYGVAEAFGNLLNRFIHKGFKLFGGGLPEGVGHG